MIDSGSNYGINLLPINGRTLDKKGNSKENYQEQLMFNIEELIKNSIELYDKYGELSILDIGGNNSTAIKELKGKLIEKGIPENKILLNKIDLDNINESGVDFLNGDLEDDDFLISILEKLGTQSQGIIFMNQVSQYLGDRFKIIKFICELLLKKDGKMFLNLIPKSFYCGTTPLVIFEEEINKIIQNESRGFKINSKKNPNLGDLRMYEISKIDENGNIEFPEYLRVMNFREVDGFKLTAYNFRKRTDLKTLKTKIETKKIINENL
ncbi:MAG: hypothetical protein PHV23_04500 [Candidatus Gracilibacteria bacterium]|nr:hypothetical protein [Candidatus Gracilibacteria bacterium]